MPNPFDDFARDLARNGNSLAIPDVVDALDDRTIESWIEREIADNDGSPAWTLRDVLDEITDNEQLSRLVLSAAMRGRHDIVGVYITAALKTAVAKAAARKAASDIWIGDALRPLKELIDHFDAIAVDQRAIAREARP